MHQVTFRDLHNILGAVSILNENLDLATLAQRTIAAVTRVLPNDMVTYNEVDLVKRADRILVAPHDARLMSGTPEYAAFIRHIDEHPLIAHNVRFPDPVPRKISDFLNDRQFRSLGLHSDFFRLFNVNYQMALVMHHAGKRMIGIAANRTLSDFTERERACLTLLRSHVVQAYRHGLSVERIRAESRRGGEDCGDKWAESGLTQREAEVLYWVSLGKSNNAVARIIGASTATVKKHLEHVYEKLDVSNRTAASTLYFKFTTRKIAAR